MGVIYSISFAGSTRRYIGSAANMRTRLSAHMHRLRSGNHHSILLQRAAAKYGLENIVVETLETDVDKGDLIEREQVWMDRFAGCLYNRAPRAKSRLGLTMPDSARAKISASLVGNSYRSGIPHDAASKAKISAGLKRAYENGKRQAVHHPENLREFNLAVARGDRPHPSPKPERDLAIAKSYARTKSLAETGREFELTASACGQAIRRALGCQLDLRQGRKVKVR